ncbi:MAG: RNA 2',3'-cyclic phosphodiesterase [Gammaproteobacteria bacterium]|nr:MAG: RNA 2',3'-cyclic phosphodiesterase [Gammaproteobacteria bacterium]
MAGTAVSGRRLFYALWPDDRVRRVLARWQRDHLPPQARPTHVADLHLTLHFLGQVEEERLESLLALGRQQRFESFELVLDRIGHWSRPRVLWVGPSEIPESLSRLYGGLGQGLTQLGFELDPRPFAPHVTLARRVARLPEGLAFTPLRWQVSEWALVESRAGERPLYHPLECWSLDGDVGMNPDPQRGL